MKIVVAVTLLLGICSLLCLMVIWLALTDIWHGLGSPDFWAGEGMGTLHQRGQRADLDDHCDQPNRRVLGLQ